MRGPDGGAVVVHRHIVQRADDSYMGRIRKHFTQPADPVGDGNEFNTGAQHTHGDVLAMRCCATYQVVMAQMRRVKLANHQPMGIVHTFHTAGARAGVAGRASSCPQFHQPRRQISKKIPNSAAISGKSRLQNSGIEITSTTIHQAQLEI